MELFYDGSRLYVVIFLFEVQSCPLRIIISIKSDFVSYGFKNFYSEMWTPGEKIEESRFKDLYRII